MPDRNNDRTGQPAVTDTSESWFLSKKTPNILLGLVFALLGLIGFSDYGFLGHFIAYVLIYAFGVFVYPALSLLIILGLFMAFAGRWPHFRINFTGLGYVLVFLFGALASTLNAPDLTLATFADDFTAAMTGITSGIMRIDSIFLADKVYGGFVGYFIASVFLTGLGEIGTAVFCYLFLLFGFILCVRMPLLSLASFIRDAAARSQARKARAAAARKNEAKPAVETAAKPVAEAMNPFKESSYGAKPEEEADAEHMPKKEDKTRHTFFGIGRQEEEISLFDGTEKETSPMSEELKPAVSETGPDIGYPDGPARLNEPSPFHISDSAAKPDPERIVSQPPARPENKQAQPAASQAPASIEEENKDKPESDEENEAVKPKQTTFASPYVTKPAVIKPDSCDGSETAARGYTLPSMSLLVKRQDFGKFEQNQRAAEMKIPIINEVFRKLNIGAQVESYTIGPSVTRFNIKREPGVRVSQLANPDVEQEMKIDLKGDMSVRIEAVVRGYDTSGVEIGNVAPTTVSFRDCFAQVERIGDDKLMVPLGENISSDVITVSLDELPHLLIAGTTGSGKTVFIHSIIMTLIMRNYPEDLKLILVDPKQVEFTRYTGIPHLYCPIITNVTHAVAMLKKLVSEMERRYAILTRYYCSKIQEYNKMRQTRPDLEPLPYLICIIDEFADMMGQDPRNVDMFTQRLAQKARAAGIYLIISTQRPSVKCITGTIKANIPARIALYLPTSIDSRTILDEGGAETLLGHGDMLARIPQLKSTVRLQSAYVSNEEISAVCDYLRQQAKPVFNQEFVNFTADESGDLYESDSGSDHRSSGFEDDLYDQVKSFVLENDVASTSSLERRFGIGFGRAAAMLDAMEEEGLVRTVMPGNRREVVHDE